MGSYSWDKWSCFEKAVPISIVQRADAVLRCFGKAMCRKRKCVKHILDFCPESSHPLSGHWVSIHTRWLTGPRWGCIQMSWALDHIKEKPHGTMSASRTTPDWVLPNARCRAADTWTCKQVARLFLFIAQGLSACNSSPPWLFWEHYVAGRVCSALKWTQSVRAWSGLLSENKRRVGFNTDLASLE